MKTARRIMTAAILCTALAFATSLRAQTEAAPAATAALQAIPDDALGFVLIKNLGQTDKAISNLAALVQAPVPSVLALFKAQADIQEGLDQNGSAAIALLPSKSTAAASAAPVPMVFFPVTNYKKFIGQFQPDDATAEITGVTIAGHALVVGHKDSFAIFTLPDHKEQLAKLIASTKGVDSLLKSFEPWIGRHQISFVATPSGSKMLFQAGAAAMKQAEAAIARMKQNAQQSAQFATAFEMYVTALTKMSEEVDAFGVGLSLDESSNLSIDSHTKFVAGGDWETAMKGLKPAEENRTRFAGLQASPFMFAGQGVIPAAWTDGLAEFSAKYMDQMSKAGGGEALTEQQRKDYTDAFRSIMKGMQSVSAVMQTPKPGGSIYDGIVELMKVDDAPTFLGSYQKSIDQMIEISKGRKNFPVKFSEAKKIEIDGHPGLAISMDLSGVLAAQKDPAAAKLMPLLFGPNGTMSMKMIAADEHTIVASIGSEDHAKEALAAFKNPQSNLASDPDVGITLKLLPPDAQWVGLVSIKGYVDFISSIIAEVSPNGGPKGLPEFPAMPPIGFAAAAGGSGLDTQMVLPAETIVGISKVVHHAMGRASQPGN